MNGPKVEPNECPERQAIGQRKKAGPAVKLDPPNTGVRKPR